MIPWFQGMKEPPAGSRGAEIQPNAFGALTGSPVASRISPTLSVLVRQRAIASLNKAIRAFPVHEKLEYLEATRLAPTLVETESDPMLFLRFAGMNAPVAAQRLLAYWRKRKQAFGPLRAYLPLNLSGNGALDFEDIKLVQCGSVVVLPNDSQGRSIILFDRSREPVQFQPSLESRLRVAFFFTHQLTTNPKSEGDGCVFIVRPSRALLDKAYTQEMAELFRTAIPVRIKAIHTVFYGESKQNLLQHILPFMMEHIGRFFSSKMVVHNGGSVNEIVQKLALHGIYRESLPDHLGGVWSHVTDFSKFLIQHGMPLVAGGRATEAAHSAAIVTMARAGTAATTNTTSHQASMGHPRVASVTPSTSSSSIHQIGAMQDRQLDEPTGNKWEILPVGYSSTPGAYAGVIRNQGLASPSTASGSTPSLDCTSRGIPLTQRFGSGNEDQSALPAKSKAAYLEALRGLQHQGEAEESKPRSYLPFDNLNTRAAAQTLSLYECTNKHLTASQGRSPLPFGHIGKGTPNKADLNTLGSQVVEEAMARLPKEDKEAYLEAVSKVPNLVKKESDPARFLKLEKFNAVAAAERLAAYWRIRREVFGERAFLPMDQTGDGAMTRRDIAILQTGYLMQLPNDAGGRSVVFCDGARLRRSSRTSQLRCFFYMWSVVSESELSRTEGFSLIYTMTEPSFDRACKECLDHVINSIPVKLKCFHLLGCIPEDTTESDFRNGQLRATIEKLDNSIQDKVVAHVCETSGEFTRKLGAFGMSRDRLPKAVGGNFGFQEFLQWQELRVQLEWDLSIHRDLRDVAASYSIPAFQVASFVDEKGKIERKRRMNVIYSRRKRERKRAKVEGLHEQCLQLKEKRVKLVREGRRLEELLENAETMVSNILSKQG